MASEVFVFVPSYNHAPFISECLRSIINQTHAPRKLLVIDDGSVDDSPKAIETILKDCPFDSELIVRENRGLCRTLNEGFELCGGKYFAYLGSDDYWLPTFLESRVQLLENRENAVLGYGHAYLVDDRGVVFDSTDAHTDSWGNYPDGDARAMLLRGVAPISSSVFYRRSALERVRWNEDARLEDYEMYLKLMNLGEFAFQADRLSAWRHHDRNTSGDRMLMLNELIAAQDRNLPTLGLSRENLNEVQAATRFLYARVELQHGNKRAAMDLAKNNWRGAESAYQLLKFCLRFLVPTGLVNLVRKSGLRPAVKTQ